MIGDLVYTTDNPAHTAADAASGFVRENFLDPREWEWIDTFATFRLVDGYRTYRVVRSGNGWSVYRLPLDN